MNTREEIRRLVDDLPDSELDAARRYLEFLRQSADPVLQSILGAREDDEPDTPDDQAAAGEARSEYRRGEGISSEQARQELLP